MSKDPLNDNISSVSLISHMGDDLMVVNAARVSMHKESEWDYIPIPADEGEGELQVLPEPDTRLISYLAKHNHWTPFSHPQIQLRIKMPIFIARQWFKHMVGFTRNEVSRRYVSDEPELYVPKEWRKKAANVKQGSSDEVVPVVEANGRPVGDTLRIALYAYEDLLSQGVCPEQARMVLPQSMYTEFIETGSLAAYARLAKLRLDPHAQKEIQWYAQAVNDLIEPLFPVSWKALTN
jgi:thymidylate synthase (FAD)